MGIVEPTAIVTVAAVAGSVLQAEPVDVRSQRGFVTCVPPFCRADEG